MDAALARRMNQPNHVLAPTVAPTAWPLPKAVIAIICIACPVIGGSVLYYAYKQSCPPAARFANRLSWIAFGVWLVLGVVQHEVKVGAQKWSQRARDNHSSTPSH